MGLEWVEGDLDFGLSPSSWIRLRIVRNGTIRFDLCLHLFIDVIPSTLPEQVVTFSMRCEVGQVRHGFDAVHVSGKFIVVRGMDVSIEMTLHLENHRIVLRLGARPLVAFAADGEAIPQRLRLFGALTEMHREGSPREEIVIAAPWAFNVAQASGRHCRLSLRRS